MQEEPTRIRVKVTFEAEINSDFLMELKRIVDHHLDQMIDLDQFPEIKRISKATVFEVKDGDNDDTISMY